MRIANHRPLRVALSGAFAALLLPLNACDNVKHNLLDAPDPDIITPSVITSPEAADAVRVGVLGRLRSATAGGEGWVLIGLLTDEWKSSDTFSQRNETDARNVQESNGNVSGAFSDLQRLRGNSREAITLLKQYKPNPAWGIGQMYMAMGYAELTLAENWCNGIPLGESSLDGSITYTDGLTNEAILTRAAAHFDTALANALPATDPRSVEVRQMATVYKARALVDLAKFSEAAALVTPAAMPTNTNVALVTFSLTTQDNQIWSYSTSQKRYTVGDSFDVSGTIRNALPFASGGDPRVRSIGQSVNSSNGRGFDGSTNFVAQNNYARSDAAWLVSGVDARLIEAEARLQAQDIPGMMLILNDLRSAARQLTPSYATPVMAALPVPANQAAAVTLFFREKAFWQWGRAFRMSDLRRQVRQYGKTEDQVFPKGTFFKGDVYGVDVNFPVPTGEYNNPNFHGCIDRRA